MHNYQIFSAASLSDVLRQLQMYRPTGLLTIRYIAGPHQEEACISVEQGNPVTIRRGQIEEKASDTLISWINTCGEVHFFFQVIDRPLSLPSPGHTTDPHRETSIPTRTQIHQNLSDTPISQPSQHMPAIKINKQTRTPIVTRPLTSMPSGQAEKVRTDKRAALTRSSDSGPLHPPVHTYENIVPIYTTLGRDYPIVKLPRYDRTIFLLINGKRNAIELSQLTKRPEMEVVASLNRLRDQRLIIFNS